MRLSGKRALLIGAATGIGRSTAQDFAREGARIVIADINFAEAERTAASIRANGGQAHAVACDVCDEQSVQRVVEDAEKSLGGLDTLVFLAGLQRIGPIEAFDSGAVIAFTVAMAQELAPFHIRVNSVLPGWIDTPFNAPSIELMGGVAAHAEVIKRVVPLGRQGTPEEVSPIYVFLASEEARYITAKSIMVDGGMAH